MNKQCLFGCRFNSQILMFVTHQLKCARTCCPVSEDPEDNKMGEDASACNTSMVLLNKGRKIEESSSLHCLMCSLLSKTQIKYENLFTGQAHSQEPSPVLMVDELLILNPHKLSFSDAGLRIMMTPHFSPRTRLSMAGRMLISEVFYTHVTYYNKHLL